MERALYTMAFALTCGVIAGACSAGSFACQQSGQCRADGQMGVCQDDGFCSFPSDQCASGQRYGEHSGPLSGECVPGSDSSTSATVLSTTSTSSPSPPPTLPLDSTDSLGSTSDASGETWDASSSSSTGEPLDPDLLLWLEFDQKPDGATPDSSATMSDGTCEPMACPLGGPGILGPAAVFDGSNDAIEVPYAPWFDTPEGVTVSAWIQLETQPATHRAIVTKPVGAGVYNSWELYFYPSGTAVYLRFGTYYNMSLTRAELAGPFPLDEWMFVAGTWDADTGVLTLWVDGILADEVPIPELAFDDHPIYVGADNDNGPTLEGNFLGSIDDVRVYGRALSEAELLELAQARE